MQKLTEFIKQLLQEHYDLGEVMEVTAIKAGDTNKSFLASCRKGGTDRQWYIRQYNRFEEEQDIIYEHAFERYLEKQVNGRIQTIMPIANRDGGTWLYETFEGQKNFYAVFNVISGREPYSWEFNNLSAAAIDSCAEITARFQAWGWGFEAPEGSGRHEPLLEEQFKQWKRDLPAALEEKKQSPKLFRRFTEYYELVIPFLTDTIDFCAAELERYRDDLKMCINHKDLNPGNMMFDEEDHVCAIFDMDWVNTDYRLYDIAWMGYQAIASWDVSTFGEVPLDKIGRFLAIYNQTMVETESPIGPLTRREMQFLPVMMIIGALKVIMDFTCYEDHTGDPYRMFVNTWRFVNSVRYMREHLDEMTAAICGDVQ